MSLGRLRAVARKEFRHIMRDPRTLFLVTVGPALLLLTLSYVFALDVGRVNIALYDLDDTPLSRELIANLTADGDLAVVARMERAEDTRLLFTREVADLVLTIPRGFDSAVLRGEPTEISCVVDGADALTARQTISMVQSRISAFAAGLASRRAPALISQPRIDVHSRAWYNGTLDTLVSMVPGMLAVILCMPVLALALAVTREKETGSFEGLMATPVRGAEYLLGKLVAYAVSGLVSSLSTWLVATLWFRVPFRGSFLVFLLLAADYLVAGMGITLVLAAFVRNQQTVTFLVLTILFVPSFFITGLVIPVTEGHLMRQLAYALPTTHFIVISRAVFLKGLGLAQLWRPALALLVTGFLGLGASLALFRKRIS